MPYYLLQASYSRTGWAALVQNPHDRVAAVQTAAARLGGTLQGMYMSFGEYDVVAIYRMPDDVSAAGVAMAISAGGATRAVRTTPLLSFEDGVEAMRMAGESGYQGPRFAALDAYKEELRSRTLPRRGR